MKKIIIATFGTMIMLMLVGCNGTSNPASVTGSEGTDQEEISEIIEQEMAEYFETDLALGEGSGLSKSAEEIETDGWFREITSRSLHVDVEFPGDGTAFVTATAQVEGILNLVVKDSSVTTIYEKPFADTITRYALFKRLPAEEPRPPYRRWYLDSISFADVVSTPVNSVDILSVSVENLSSGYMQVFDDPAALLDRETEVPDFQPGEEVELVITAASADLYAFLHTGRSRIPMTNNGDGTYSGVYTVGNQVGPRFAAVDLLTGGTLYDTEAPYDANAWGCLYRIR